MALVITKDGVILSGHRRYEAARMLGQVTVPCRLENIASAPDRRNHLCNYCGNSTVSGTNPTMRSFEKSLSRCRQISHTSP